MAANVGLTDSKIAGLKPPKSGQVEYPDKAVAGLRVRIGASGAKTFILRKRIGGKVRNMTLGRYGPRFGLAVARKKARLLINDIEAGRDPASALVAERKNGATPGTVRALFGDYYRAEVGAKRSAREIRRIFDKYILPEMGDRLAESVTRADVTRLVDSVATAGERETPVMARAVAAQLSAFYSWAMPRLEGLPSNPCRDAGKPAKPKPRERVLRDEELRALWEVAADESVPFGPGVQLLILTGQRRDEVFSAPRAEFGADEWTIGADRAKNGVAHIVPLSRPAKVVLGRIPEIEGSAMLLPSRSNLQRGPSGFSKAWARMVAAVETKLGPEVEHFTMHDLRRTMATGMQRLGVKLEVVEAVLNHVSGSRAGIVGVYQRHDFLAEKRHALDAWAAEVERIAAGGKKGNIVALRR